MITKDYELNNMPDVFGTADYDPFCYVRVC